MRIRKEAGRPVYERMEQVSFGFEEPVTDKGTTCRNCLAVVQQIPEQSLPKPAEINDIHKDN